MKTIKLNQIVTSPIGLSSSSAATIAWGPSGAYPSHPIRLIVPFPPGVYKKIGYDPMHVFAPVALMAVIQSLMAVSNNLPAKNVDALNSAGIAARPQ